MDATPLDPKAPKPGTGTRSGTRSGRAGRRLLLLAIGVLYVVSIPWYREGGSEPGRWLGLPDWAAVAIVCYVGVAILNAFAWLLTDIDDAAPSDPASQAPSDPPVAPSGSGR